ncbi:MAG: HD domain-containing protein [Clostridia bacterium]|nr:HD domain-containing protein [Clostridia bacterium]
MRVEEIKEKMIAYSDRNMHDIDHFLRVHSFSHLIGTLEKLDGKTLEILEISALVHDIACPLCRVKYGSTLPSYQEKEGEILSREFLNNTPLSENDIERIAYITGHHHSPEFSDGPDFQILLEADYIANAIENSWEKEKIRSDSSLFRTETGKRILKELFEI